MSVYQIIKAQQLEARKAKQADRASLLTTVLGEFARRDTKDDPTDEQVFKTVQKLRNSVEQTYNISATPELAAELSILDSILELAPKAASVEDVKSALQEHLADNTAANMGTCMKFLKERFGSALDGGSANGIVREMLASR